MVKAIKFYDFGGPEVLKMEETEIDSPGDDDVLIRQTAIGLNFLDIMVRLGKYPLLPELPATPGAEAAGVIEAVGKNVTNFKVGERVAYAATIPGAYTEARVINCDQIVKIPDGVSDEVAAATALKGMTAEYLVQRCYKASKGDVALVHAAAGGVGQILCQWLNYIGVTVIGTTSSENKKDIILSNGGHYAINSSTEDIADYVKKVTDGSGVDVVYDSVGPAVWLASISSLKPRGYYVNFGNSSGPLELIDPVQLNTSGSLFFTKTSMRFYQLDRKELENSAESLFGLIEKGILNPNISQKYSLSDVAKAHKDIADKKTIGSSILIP